MGVPDGYNTQPLAEMVGSDDNNNEFSSANVVANADGSILERLEWLQGMPLVERCIEKSDGAVLKGADPLFVITGGPILVTSIVGIVTTIIGWRSQWNPAGYHH